MPCLRSKRGLMENSIHRKINPNFAPGSLCPSLYVQTVRDPHDKMIRQTKLKLVKGHSHLSRVNLFTLPRPSMWPEHTQPTEAWLQCSPWFCDLGKGSLFSQYIFTEHLLRARQSSRGLDKLGNKGEKSARSYGADIPVRMCGEGKGNTKKRK